MLFYWYTALCQDRSFGTDSLPLAGFRKVVVFALCFSGLGASPSLPFTNASLVSVRDPVGVRGRRFPGLGLMDLRMGTAVALSTVLAAYVAVVVIGVVNLIQRILTLAVAGRLVGFVSPSLRSLAGGRCTAGVVDLVPRTGRFAALVDPFKVQLAFVLVSLGDLPPQRHRDQTKLPVESRIARERLSASKTMLSELEPSPRDASEVAVLRARIHLADSCRATRLVIRQLE
ncbi:hypothetical protein FHS27_001882 [Rhodopirellula rubra]|uniref:Uncharacterized protein n=1 Tax=Aporhodopirellula rubra TaxID=980271 RepID=A0A7W5DXL8_9BACT|nr:hypothetical protein [Aporhodopirellula rubra]